MSLGLLRNTWNIQNVALEKKATEQEKWGEQDHEKVNETYFATNNPRLPSLADRFHTLLQASHRPRFRWLLNWCEPYRARSRSSGGSVWKIRNVLQGGGFDFWHPSKMVDFESILIFWNTRNGIFVSKGRVSLIFSALWGSVLFQWSQPLSGFVIFVPLLVPWAFYKLALELSWGIFSIFKA